MEARRRELLSQEDGYWRRRMAQEAAAAVLAQEATARVPPLVPPRACRAMGVCGGLGLGAGCMFAAVSPQRPLPALRVRPAQAWQRLGQGL